MSEQETALQPASKTTDKRTELMASTHIASAITRLAVPAMVSMIVMAIYNMADTYFVSLVSGSDLEVAAISVFMPVLLLMQSVAVLFAAGGGALVSRVLGEQNLEKASRAATATLSLSFISGVVVLGIGLLFARPILFFVGASDATIGMAQEYAVVMFLAAPIQLTNMSFNNLLRAEGNALRSMVGTVTGAVLNIILDPIFISEFGMGVRGAAIATAIAQCVAFVILGSAYWMKRTTVPFRIQGFAFEADIVWYIIRIGLSTFLIEIFTAVGFTIINIYARPYGDDIIAAIGIVNRLQYLGFAVLFGFAQGFQPVCGYNFGAGRFRLLKTVMTFGITVSMLLGAGLVAMFRMCGSQLVALFANSQTVIRTGTQVLRWFTMAYPLTAFSLIMLMTCQALGKALPALAIAICRQGACMIASVILFTSWWGFQGILASPLASDIASGLLSLGIAIWIYRYVRRERAARGEEACENTRPAASGDAAGQR